MNVVLYMAMSVNGMIATTDGESDFLSEEETAEFIAKIRSAGCIVVGSTTYQILTELPEFQELKDVKLVVVSAKGVQISDPAHQIAHSPKEALEMLSSFSEVVIAGGGALNASFLADNLVDELYLDVEPIVLGEGIPLFRGQDFERKLLFLGQKMFSENEIQLHYQVIK